MAARPSGIVSRRALLALAAAGALGGCSPRAGARRPAVGATPGTGTELYLGNGTTAADAAAFGRFDRSIAPVSADSAVALRAQNRMPFWAVARELQPAVYAQSWRTRLYPLDEALHLDNFQPATVLAGALGAFTVHGQVCGMPLSATPLVLAYRPAAFAAAGVAPPAAGWTFADLAAAGDAPLAAAPALRAQGLYGPFPPLLGTNTVPVTSGSGRTVTVPLFGALTNGLLTQAFVAGYGGWLVKDGRFSLTNPGAVQGLSALTAFATRYGAPDRRLQRSAGGSAAGREGAAMDFVLYPSVPPAGWRYSRLPRLPVAPAIPVQLEGMRLIAESGNGLPAAGIPTAPPAITAATVQFAVWQYGRQAGTLGPTLAAPVLADAAVQARYWSAPEQAAHVQPGIGDWAHYLVAYQDWPGLGAGPPVAFQLFDLMSRSSALRATTPSDLEPLLATLERSLNAAYA